MITFLVAGAALGVMWGITMQGRPASDEQPSAAQQQQQQQQQPHPQQEQPHEQLAPPLPNNPAQQRKGLFGLSNARLAVAAAGGLACLAAAISLVIRQRRRIGRSKHHKARWATPEGAINARQRW